MSNTAAYSRRARIGLFGGSFNPPHSGHLDLSVCALDVLKLDQVWWIVTPSNPLKDAGDYAPFESRVAQCEALTHGHKITVSRFEETRQSRYSIDTLRALRKNNPTTDFVWLMGADSLTSFHRWKDWEAIAALMPMAVFNRPGFEPGGDQDPLASPAASALARAQIKREDAGALATMAPPAWVFILDTNNPNSSTALREANG